MKKITTIWKSYTGVVSSLIFGFLMCIGYAFYKENTWAMWFEDTKSILLLVIFTLAIALLYKCVAALIFYGFEKLYNTKQKENRFYRFLYGKNCWLKCTVILLLFWSPFLALSYPGGSCTDVSYQITQILGSVPYSTQQPMLSTLLIGVFIRFGQWLGRYNVGLFAFICFQSASLAAVLAYSISFLKRRKVSHLAKTIVLCIYGLVPMYSNFATMAIKDTLYAASCVLFVIKCAELIEMIKKEEACTWRFAIGYVFAAVCTIMLRNNGVYVIVFTSIAFLVLLLKKYIKERKKVGKTLFCIILPFVIYIGLNTLIMAVFQPQEETARGFLSIPFQQTARYAKEYPQDVTEEEAEIISKVMDNYEAAGELYDPNIADPIVYNYNFDATTEELLDYFGVWAKQLIKHPLCYVEAATNMMYGWLYPPARNDIRHVGRLDIFSQSYYGGDEFLVNVYEMLGSFPIYALFQSVGAYVWLLILLTFYGKKKKLEKAG